MERFKNACDVIFLVGLLALAGYFLYGEFAPAKYTYAKHTVVTGDTLYKIAQRYGKESTEDDLWKIVWDIRQANGIDGKGVGTLQPGRELQIPIRK